MPNFTYEILSRGITNVDDDNVDVEVALEDGRRFGATFFTISNIGSLFEKNRATGECASGLYLWALDMIIVKRIDPSTIERSIENLIENGEFERAFSRIG